MSLDALEVRQHLVPGPAAVPERSPVVVIHLLAAHVDHRVDRRAAAQHFPARVAEAATVEAGLIDRAKAPVRARIADRVEVTDGHVDPEPVVLAARLDQQDVRAAVLGEAIGEHAPGAARADDDVVELAEGFHRGMLANGGHAMRRLRERDPGVALLEPMALLQLPGGRQSRARLSSRVRGSLNDYCAGFSRGAAWRRSLNASL